MQTLIKTITHKKQIEEIIDDCSSDKESSLNLDHTIPKINSAECINTVVAQKLKIHDTI
jgi:hypothetical protein